MPRKKQPRATPQPKAAVKKTPEEWLDVVLPPDDEEKGIHLRRALRAWELVIEENNSANRDGDLVMSLLSAARAMSRRMEKFSDARRLWLLN